MRRLVIAALFAGAVVACNQLHLTEGNAYPCDFSQPAGVRDMPCIGTDVCGINDVCVAYVNEGPRFEGGITAARLPAYVRDGYKLTDTTLMHPGALNQPITFLAHDALKAQGPMVVGTATDLFSVKGTTLGLPTNTPDAGDFSQAVLISLDDAGVLPAAFDALVGLVGTSMVCAVHTENDVNFTCDPGADAVRLRSSLVPPVVQLAPPPAHGTLPLQAITADGSAYQVELRGPQLAPTLQLGEQYDVRNVFDVAVLNHEVLAATPVVLARDGLWLRQPDAGFEQQLQAQFGELGVLNLNFASTLLTASNPVRLSTWEVSVTPPPQRTHTLSQAWPDCAPCRTGVIRAVTPVPSSDGVGVEVLCRSDAGFSLVRVTGSHAAGAMDACETQVLSPPLDPALISDGNLTIANAQRGISFGNSRGSVWSGESLSEVLPIAMERVPLDVTTISPGIPGAHGLVAITDRYLAVYDPSPPLNGFRRVSAAEFNVGDDLRFVSAVHGSDGWGVLANGVVAHAQLGNGNSLDFGPRLVAPSGEPVLRSAGGEAYVFNDAGVGALFVMADDGLYAVFNPLAALGDSAGGTSDVTPQLQPEPSVPIRSLALERTPLGTNGVNRARGYLVTSRNVYEWVFANQRWTSKQLVLGGGEPVEVWFDTARSALGRVGYADGQVYTLPSGFQLTEALPLDDGGATLKLLDYENFGGWPVALTTTGLWAASWDLDGGVVENHFPDGRSNRPMEWHKLMLADGSEPWSGSSKGRLFVNVNPPLGSTLADGGTTRTFSLFVFLPDRVLKVAEYERN